VPADHARENPLIIGRREGDLGISLETVQKSLNILFAVLHLQCFVLVLQLGSQSEFIKDLLGGILAFERAVACRAMEISGARKLARYEAAVCGL
jgi:hypothetical protein